MKAIIPVAGVGTRLRPHTHTAPKVMLNVAGKPMLAHIVDELVELGVEEITFIVGYLGHQVREFITENYSIKANFVEQVERRGLGHAISLAEPFHKGDKQVLIVLGDTIFRADLKSLFAKTDTHIAVKEVRDPQRFGIVELAEGRISRLVEKPDNPKTNLAIVGIYFICNPGLLFESLRHIIDNNITTRGEFQLTDALQRMIEKGEVMKPFLIEGWHDCGKSETLLETNRELLLFKYNSDAEHEKLRARYPGCIIKAPVSIHPSARIENSIIGPYVTVARNAMICDSIITNSILSENAEVHSLILDASIISNNAKAEGIKTHLNLGDSSECRLT